MWKNRYIESNNETLPIMDEILVTLDYHGNILKEKSLYQIFKKLIPDEVYENISEYIQHENLSDLIKEKPNDFYLKSNLPWDVLHMNSLTLIEEDTDIFKKGQFLVSMRTINTIAVFDPNLNEIIWGYSGDLIRQHNPTLLANGNILVFDNGGKVEYPISTTNYLTKERNEQERLFTRIIEIEPKTKNIVWEYTSEIPEEFYSKIMGSSQRLDNGNTLITDAFNGKVFEINSRKKIVWNYKAPLENMSFYRGYRLNKNEVNIINDFIHR